MGNLMGRAERKVVMEVAEFLRQRGYGDKAQCIFDLLDTADALANALRLADKQLRDCNRTGKVFPYYYEFLESLQTNERLLATYKGDGADVVTRGR